MLANFPYHNEGEHIERQFRIWYAVAVGVLFGVVSLLLVLLINRHQSKLGWQVYTALVLVSFLWFVLLVPEVQASGLGVSSVLTAGIGRTLLVLWIVTIPFAPAIALSMHGWDFLVRLLRPRTTQEHLLEQERIHKQKEHQLSRKADELSRQLPRTQPNKLALGVFIKFVRQNDSFPPWLGIEKRRNSWVYIDDGLLPQHVFIQGTTGAGKSVTLTHLAHQELLATDRDLYVIDGKGEASFALDLANLMYQAGRGSIPVFKLGLQETGSVYHGFCGGREAIYNRLCALVGTEDAEGDARYYADVNRDLLQLICFAPQGPPRSLQAVQERLSLDWLQSAYQNHAQELKSIAEIDAKRLEGLLIRIRPLVREFAPIVNPTGISLEDTRGAIFSIRTQSVGDTSRRFLHFLLEDFKDFVGNRQKRPGLLIIDEFGAFNNHNIVDLLMLARSANFGVILAKQDITSLGDERTKRLMGTDFPEDVAKLAGTIYQIEASIQQEEGHATEDGSAKVQHAFSIDMNEAASLQAGEGFIIRQRHTAKLKIPKTTQVAHHADAVVKQSFLKAQTPQPPLNEVALTDEIPELEM